MSSKNTTWIDLTDMTVWSGFYTGIQRVTYNYAQRFVDDGAKYFFYDSADRRYIEIPFEFLDLIKELKEHPPLTPRQKLKYKLQEPYKRLPKVLQDTLRPGVKFTEHQIRSIIHHLFDKGGPKSLFHEYPTADFRKGDVVLLMGAGWNEDQLIDNLCEVRQKIGIKIVQHINDVLPVYQPHLFADDLPRVFTPYIEKIIRNADMVTAISKATAKDIATFCTERQIKQPPVKVVRLGEDIKVSQPAKPVNVEIADTFLLCVGTVEIRKNYLLIYQAVKLAQLENKPLPQIVIVGRKGWLTGDLTHVLTKDPSIAGKIVWLNSVDDQQMDWLFHHAAFTLFPSLCEGWGLPVAESLQHGKFCLASGVSSMLEIGDGMIDYFSPFDARSCMDKMLQYLKDDAYKAKNQFIQQNYKVYTWDESYKDFKATLTDL